MADTTDIIKALKYWDAERFKELQRKLRFLFLSQNRKLTTAALITGSSP